MPAPTPRPAPDHRHPNRRRLAGAPARRRLGRRHRRAASTAEPGAVV